MKRSFRNRQKSSNRRGDITIILIIIVVIGAILLTGSYLTYPFAQQSTSDNNPTNFIPINTSEGSSSKDALQMKVIKFTTPTPTPTPVPPPPAAPPAIVPPPAAPPPGAPPPAPHPKQNEPGQSCIHEQLISNGCICQGAGSYPTTCSGGQITGVHYDPSQVGPSWCTHKADGYYCVGKPVIYLYPKVAVYVNVKLTIPGTITESIPSYPDSGWQHILAYPDGTLMYHKNTYKELYYETSIKTINAPDSGIVIPSNQLEIRLRLLTTRLGLKPTEQQEFLDYWLPKLYALKSPYILFSVLSPQEKDRIDHVDISPKPDTFIEFLAYFKPLNSPITILKPLVLPPAPTRIGFTAVEWGGTIDYH